jgi:hypothetical protein
MRSPDRLVAVGGSILGVGALLAISWLIYVTQSKISFWAWPGIAGVCMAAVGCAALVVGFVMPGDKERGGSADFACGIALDESSSGP